MSQMLKTSDEHTPKPETKLKQWYANQKESSKEILVFSQKVIGKYSGYMFVVSLKPTSLTGWKGWKDQKNLTTKKANILQKQFANVFTKELNAEVPVLDKITEVNLPNIIITEQMVRN